MRKIISIFMTIALCLASFVGCGTDPNSESLEELIVLGAQYLVDGNYSEAVVAFDKAIKVDDKSVVAYVGLGDGNLGLEDYDKAGEAYEKAIEIDDRTIEAYIGCADAYLFAENTESAVAILNEGFEATGNAELSNIVESINAGTYEPSILHMDWKSMCNTSGTVTDADENEGVHIAKEIDYYAADGEYEPYISKREKYDSEGNLIAQEDEGLSLSGEKDVCYYDEEGKLIKFEWYGSNGELKQTTFKYYGYSEDGKTIKDENYDGSGRFTGYSMTYYDEKGNKIKYELYTSTNSLQRCTYFDKNGNKIRYEEYDNVGKIKSYGIYCYDESGNLTKYEPYDAEGNLIGMGLD